MHAAASPVLPPAGGSGYRCGSRASGFAALVAGSARLFVAVIFVALTAGIHMLLVGAALFAALAAALVATTGAATGLLVALIAFLIRVHHISFAEMKEVTRRNYFRWQHDAQKAWTPVSEHCSTPCRSLPDDVMQLFSYCNI